MALFGCSSPLPQGAGMVNCIPKGCNSLPNRDIFSLEKALLRLVANYLRQVVLVEERNRSLCLVSY